jgi:hypothetical protein
MVSIRSDAARVANAIYHDFRRRKDSKRKSVIYAFA